MKKLVFLFIILGLVSCQSQTIKYKTNTGNFSNQAKIEVNTGNIDTGAIASNVEKITSTGVIESTGTVDTINTSDSTGEKDVVIVKNKEDDNSGNVDDFSGKTQQEVVDEMGAYVDDLFNMVEKDVK